MMYSVIVADNDRDSVEQLKREINWGLLNCRLDGTACTLKESLSMVRRFQPDLVIAEAELPDSGSLELAERLCRERRERDRDAPGAGGPAVMILSGRQDFETARQAICCGVSLYLMKPFTAWEVEEGIHWVLGETARQQYPVIGFPAPGTEAASRAAAVTARTEAELSRISREAKNYSPFVREAILYVESHLNQELSLTVVCGCLALSHSYFSKKFKKETGIGYVTYVTMAKMRKAKKMMEDPRNKANEIAKSLGYYDYSYFFQNFRKYFGCSPREFKNMGKFPGRE